MRFTAIATLLSLFSTLTSAQTSPNPFSYPSNGYRLTAGQPYTLTWTATTPGSVTLVLRSGAATNLAQGTPIVTNLPNNGSYVWSVPASITQGTDYAIEIVDDSNTSLVNYAGPVVIDSTVTAASSTGVVSLGAPTGSVLPTASAISARTSAATGLSTSNVGATSSHVSTSTSSAPTSATTAAATHTGAAVRGYGGAAQGALVGAMCGLVGLVF
ncbi:hypothetical protein MRB53_036936 [Persea americana]|nr:hypothetical protein MRB53_036936 [Persea americana]